jgi:hypothetical protein
MAYEGLLVPHPNLSDLFQPPDPMGTRNAVMQGLQDGQTLAATFRRNKIQKSLQDMMQRHDITTPDGKRALVQELSDSGLGDEALELNKEFGGQNEVRDSIQGLQNVNPAYNTVEPLKGLLGQPLQSPNSAKVIDKSVGDDELKLGFNMWHDSIAQPFAEARGYKFSKGDLNRLRMTLPQQLQGSKIAEDFFRSLKPEPDSATPKPKGSGNYGFNPGGIARNLQDIDSDITKTEATLKDVQSQGPTLDQAKQVFTLQKQLNRLKVERRKYQSRAPAGSAPSKGKLNDPNLAQRYLDQAGGDKDKARALAKADGWDL